MKTSKIAICALAVAAVSGCSTWNSMDKQEKGTAVGATGGAVVGAAVGGPIGAAVGAGVGGYAGHYETKPGGIAAGSTQTANASIGSPVVRSAQQALEARGYNPGAVDGMMGPSTENAVRDYQRAQGLTVNGTLDQPTLSSLGVSTQ
jgi:phage tail tape-measure protein